MKHRYLAYRADWVLIVMPEWLGYGIGRALCPLWIHNVTCRGRERCSRALFGERTDTP